MKFLLTAIPMFAVVLAAGCSKKTESTAAAAGSGTAPAASSASGPVTDAQIIESVGWFITTRSGIANLALSPAETELLIKGIRTAAQGGKSPHDLATVGPKMDEWVKTRQDTALARDKEKNAAAATAHFAKLKGDSKVVEVPSGLRYEILAPGTGPAPKPTDTVRVHYEGRLLDGSVFDSSRQRGEPAEFPLNQVIAGWTEGLQKISKGGRAKLHIPANLAYGDVPRPGIPAGSTLVFDVELLDILSAPGAPVPMAK